MLQRATVTGGGLKLVSQLFWQHCVDVAPFLVRLCWQCAFPYSYHRRQQNSRIIKSIVQLLVKMLLPTANARGTFPEIKLLVDVEQYYMTLNVWMPGFQITFAEYFHRWVGTRWLSLCVWMWQLWVCISARVTVFLSSYNYGQIHQFVINGNSCSRTDCKMVISCEDLRRTVTRQIFLLGTSF